MPVYPSRGCRSSDGHAGRSATPRLLRGRALSAGARVGRTGRSVASPGGASRAARLCRRGTLGPRSSRPAGAGAAPGAAATVGPRRVDPRPAATPAAIRMEDAMLARDDNERGTRVGPGTPMGITMRRYWLPALLGWELPEPDGPPVRVKLLGRELVAFRNTHGRTGLVEQGCSRRRGPPLL